MVSAKVVDAEPVVDASRANAANNTAEDGAPVAVDDAISN